MKHNDSESRLAKEVLRFPHTHFNAFRPPNAQCIAFHCLPLHCIALHEPHLRFPAMVQLLLAVGTIAVFLVLFRFFRSDLDAEPDLPEVPLSLDPVVKQA